MLHVPIAYALPDPVLTEINGSAPIASTKKYSYGARNMIDRRSTTAWCTREHRASKAWIQLAATPGMWTGLGLINGYARSEKTFKENSRAKKIAIYADGKFVREFPVADTLEPQWLSFGPIRAISLKLTVDETYRGEHDDDLCITEIFTDNKVIGTWSKIDEISRHVGNRSLNPADQPLLRDIHADEAAANSFLHALALYTSGIKEPGLRMLLDLIYEVDQEKDVDVELLEGAIKVVQYFKYSPKVVRISGVTSGRSCAKGLLMRTRCLLSLSAPKI